MKKLYFLFFLFFLQGVVKSQVNLDSLWNAWSDEAKADTIRLEALNNFLWEPMLFRNQVDSATLLSDIMYDFAIKSGSRKYEAIALDNRGICNMFSGDFAKAKALFEESLEIAIGINHSRGITESYQNLSVIAMQVDADYPKAKEYALKILNVAEENSDVEAMAKAIGVLANISLYNGDYTTAEESYIRVNKMAEEVGNISILLINTNNLAGLYLNQLNFPKAIKVFTKAAEVAELHGRNFDAARSYTALSDLYSSQREYKKALSYINQAINLSVGGDQSIVSGSLMVRGDIYFNLEQLPQALENYLEAVEIAEKVGYKLQLSQALIWLGKFYREQGDILKATDYAFRGLKIAEETGELSTINFANLVIGQIYNHDSKHEQAIELCENVLENNYGLQYNQLACECLYEAHKALRHGNQALAYHERYLELSDSIHMEEIGQNLQQMEFNKQMLADSLAQVEEDRIVEQAHQKEVQAKEKQRNIFLGSGMLILAFAGGLWSRLRYIRKSKAVLQIEKDRSENLLLNILPAEVAEELKATGKAAARDFEMVSIIFTDFKQFTETSEKLSAAELVGEINYCFEGFDAIMEKYGIEKIKTIGDAYMAAGGLPVATDDSVRNTVKAALEMQDFIAKRKAGQDAKGLMAFEMRCGIHTGPVVAGIVGVKKFQYDIWGDTVNTASRMESSGKVGQVNISQNTYSLIKDESNFTFEKRGKIEVKGKGEMDMYFVQ